MSDQPYRLEYVAALNEIGGSTYTLFVAGIKVGRAEQRRRDAEICREESAKWNSDLRFARADECERMACLIEQDTPAAESAQLKEPA